MGVGERLAHAAASHRACRIKTICDFDHDKLSDVSSRLPEAQTTERAHEVLEDDELDAVIIASWDNYHFEQTKSALLAGKHVFVEKPFVVHEDEAREIRSILNARPSQVFASNLVLRTTPRFRDLRNRIIQGEMGELFHLSGDYEYGRLQKITEGWRGQLSFYSAVHGGGVHIADLLMWLSQSRISEVSAYGNAIASAGSSFKNFDMIIASLRFESGAVGSLGVNFGCMRPHYHQLRIYGTKATFENRAGSAEWHVGRQKGLEPEYLETEYPGQKKAELVLSFVKEVMGEGKCEVSRDDVFASMAVCFAIEKSAHEGCAQQVAYL